MVGLLPVRPGDRERLVGVSQPAADERSAALRLRGDHAGKEPDEQQAGVR